MQSFRTTPRPATTTLRRSLSRVLRRALDRVIAADKAYRDRARMRRLTDTLLRDVGLTRSEIDRQRR